MPTLIEVLRFSHIVVPWVVVSRRLRKGRKGFLSALLMAPSATDVKAEPPKVEEKPTKKPKRKNRKQGGRAETAKVASPGPVPPEPLLPEEPKVAEHQTHYCPECRAPVPLADEPFACPYCAAKVVPPPEVAAAYRRIVWAKRALERAERAWKRAVLWNGPVWVVLFGLAIVVWSGSYLALVIAASTERAKLPWTKLDRIVLLASAPSGIFGWWTGVVLAVNAESLGRLIAKVPRASFDALPVADIACSHCGANAQFSEGRFTTLCVYCGAEEMRPALAKAASTQAKSLKKTATFSMLDAYRAIVKRRETLLTYVDFMAAGVVAMIFIEMLEWIPIVGKVFAFFE